MSIHAPFCAPEHRSASAMDQHRRHRFAHTAQLACRVLAGLPVVGCEDLREVRHEDVIAWADGLIDMGAPL